MRSENSPKLAQREQEIEILLSNDFENMSLEELNHVTTQLNKVWGIQDGEVCYLTDDQVKSREFLSFRITQEEHKKDSISIGDCFHTHWGYDQTNVEMYKVVGFTKSGKSAIIREIGMNTVKESEGYMSDSVQPDPSCELKKKEYDKDGKYLRMSKENKPDLRVKIERSTEWNPRTNQREAIGEFHLRGSVYYAGEHKHLQTLYRIKPTEKTYRSWYA
jgi:hypothetical protein